ncbi:Uncharacterised protein [Yersinia frederiksenii]|nr:Uncharacterised protein [Yersinia frederiksenii]CNL22189.1 Uncharacterised protein [Yersinia frederiksenii]CNL33724.1 Uncharacterised protein [Yersinia frederiksenii]
MSCLFSKKVSDTVKYLMIKNYKNTSILIVLFFLM